jgi:hypothetical protein
VDSSSRPSEGPVHGVRDLPNPEIACVRQGTPRHDGSGGFKVRIVDRVDAGDRAQVRRGPGRRRLLLAHLVSPSYDCVVCVAQHANGGVVGAHDHRPVRASRSRRRPRGRGAMRARTAGTATGSGRSRRPCATRREGRSPRSSPAATRQVGRSQSGSRYGTGSRSRPVPLVSAGSGSTGSHLGRRSSARREIGPKSRFFGPIPAEMGGN